MSLTVVAGMPRLISKANALRVYRAGLVAAIVLLIHVQAQWAERQRPSEISLKRARQYFPTADRIQLRDPERALYVATNSRGDTVGALLRTSPFTDHIIGYSGPSDVLIALDGHGVVTGIELLRSGDTTEHVRTVREAPGFLRRFIGWKPSEAPPSAIEAVSGATLTSYAIAESIAQRLTGAAPSLRFPEPSSFAEVQAVFTNATRMAKEKARWRVFDRAGNTLGYVLRTSPQADNISGYRGPTDCLVALATDGRTITAVRVRKSYDTDSYVDQVRRTQKFFQLFVGRPIEEMTHLEFPKERIDGLSGATLTARAVVEGIQRRATADARMSTGQRPWRPKSRDVGLAGVITAACVLSFTPLRGRRWVRWAWQGLLIGCVGLVNHDFLSLALLGGWASGGVAWQSAIGLVALAAVSLLVPWAARRQVYCHQICPHGAAQQWLGTFGRRITGRWKAPRLGRAGWLWRILEFLPPALLAAAIVSLAAGWPLSLAKLEAFDAWVWRTAALASIVIAVVGLLVSIWIPQAYCRFGCPTGALLAFVRSSGSADRWSPRDSAALAIAGLALGAALWVRIWPSAIPEMPPTEWHGRTMGTTWSIKVRDEVADPPAVKKALDREFEWAESMTSHWRANTDLSEFNRVRSTNAMPVPWPVVTLSKWALEISKQTAGAYDVSIGGLVRLWGFGPGPRRTEPPPNEEIELTRRAVGWQKLEIGDGTIRKADPDLELDFSSIAKGWAIDQIGQVLERRGYTNWIVEAGGELRVRGRWTVSIDHPSRTCPLQDEALATSGTYRQNFQADARRYSHLLDPRTGRPVSHNTVSVSVRGPDCAHADAWSTALNVLGADEGMPLADRLGVAAQFVIQSEKGRLEVRDSATWKSRATTLGPAKDR